MTERPILFSAPMVRAILEGRKSQTRRPVRLGEQGHARGVLERVDGAVSTFRDGCMDDPVPLEVRCPFGGPGDRLWVRETWGTWRSLDNLTPSECGEVPREEMKLWYRADGCAGQNRGQLGKWRPSIHMPRWASRLTLELTSVRVERLQAISREDAIAEGLESHDDDGVTYWGPLGKGHCDPVGAYRELWEAINGPGSWKANPWVWALTFRRVPTP